MSQRLDESLLTPLYEQLAGILRNQIRSGELKPGDATPTEKELVEKYGASRITVRQAMLMLAREGLVFRKRGKGSFVCQPKIVQPLVTLRSFSDEIRIMGFEPGARLVRHGIIYCPADVAGHLDVSEGTPVLEFVRLRLADGKELSVNTSYLHPRLNEALSVSDLSADSLYQAFERRLGKIVRVAESVTATAATPEAARLLSVKEGSPLLRLERTAYLAGGEIVEFARADFRPDRYEVCIELRAFT